jgi:DNA-binding response OmpR family regulator
MIKLNRAEPSIVIIDDHATTCRIVRDMLHQMGIRRHVCEASVDSALETLSKGLPELVIVDWYLGKITGREVIQFVRRLDIARGSVTRIIVMTALPRPSIVREVAQAGEALCLAKPFSTAELSKRVLSLFARDAMTPLAHYDVSVASSPRLAF